MVDPLSDLSCRENEVVPERREQAGCLAEHLPRMGVVVRQDRGRGQDVRLLEFVREIERDPVERPNRLVASPLGLLRRERRLPIKDARLPHHDPHLRTEQQHGRHTKKDGGQLAWRLDSDGSRRRLNRDRRRRGLNGDVDRITPRGRSPTKGIVRVLRPGHAGCLCGRERGADDVCSQPHHNEPLTE